MVKSPDFQSGHCGFESRTLYYMRVGNKQNSGINGEWAHHVRGWWKRFTSGKRRTLDKKEIRDRLKDE